MRAAGTTVIEPRPEVARRAIPRLARADLRKAAVLIAGCALVAVATPALFGAAWLTTWTTCAIFAIAAAGTGVLYGWLGLTSLTQVALMGVGGWIALRLEFASSMPFLAQVVLASAITGAIGLLLAFPALRLRGLYLALVTLMVAGGFDVAFNATGFPNGGSGFLGYSATGELQRLERPGFAITDAAYFRFALAVAVIAFVVVQLHLRSGAGRAWALIERSEAAATSAGVSLTRAQMHAFALAAALCGLAGAVLAGQLGQLSPATFQISESMLLFALVVIAGAHHWLGWILAAVLYKAVPFGLSELGIEGNVATMLFGVALMASMLGSSRGAVGQIEELVAKMRGRKEQVA